LVGGDVETVEHGRSIFQIRAFCRKRCWVVRRRHADCILAVL